MVSKFFLAAGLALIVYGLWVVSLDEGGGDFRPVVGFLLALIGLIVAFFGLIGALRAGNKKMVAGATLQTGTSPRKCVEKTSGKRCDNCRLAGFFC